MDRYDYQRECMFDFWSSCCSSHNPDLTKYVTFDELDEAISGISGASYDDSEVRSQIEALGDAITATNGILPTKADLSALTATNEVVSVLQQHSGDTTPVDLSNYYTKGEVDDTVDGVYGEIQNTNLTVSGINKRVSNNTSNVYISVSGVTLLSEDRTDSFGFRVTHIHGGTENRRWYLGEGLTTPDSGQTIEVDVSILNAIADLQTRVAALEGGTTPTGDTPTSYAVTLTYSDGTTRDVYSSGFINEAQTFPSGASRTGVTAVIVYATVYGLGADTFSNCPNLSTVTIYNGLESIGVDCFKNDTSLLSINIPSTVTSISETAFDGCTNLAMFTFNSLTPPTIVNSGYERLFTYATSIMVPMNALTAYQSAWSNVSGKIQGF